MTAKAKLTVALITLLGLNGASLAAIEGYSLGDWWNASWISDSTSKVVEFFSPSNTTAESKAQEEEKQVEESSEVSGTTSTIVSPTHSSSFSSGPVGRTFRLESRSPVQSLNLQGVTDNSSTSLQSVALTLPKTQSLELKLEELSVSSGAQTESSSLDMAVLAKAISTEGTKSEKISKISRDKDNKSSQIMEKLKGINIADYYSAAEKVAKHFKISEEPIALAQQSGSPGRSRETPKSIKKLVLPSQAPVTGLTKEERIALRTVYATFVPLAELKTKSSQQLSSVDNSATSLREEEIPDHKQLTRALYAIGWGSNRIVTYINGNEADNWGWNKDWSKNIWSKFCKEECGGEQGWKELMRRQQKRKKEVFERADAITHKRWMTEWCWTPNCFRRSPEELDRLHGEANAELELAVAGQIIAWMKKLPNIQTELKI
ncbi:hypothetical protein MHLP_00385 [Candidatus Mycoplasma haematolamae str. Purdue]|uniref:Lipoprotein n=1 Tax=Mycoplasma haematolamae (strain Purdue) TaxID=1212765 RepID=I7C576_MYCHA|nr:hypothetical protein [Candidatus Mycoplasma haematolamae]AFO51657.1 hypothetical protein MHLP_00385 [Candidatus Mycoplasma haematolamae str. Purdue]